MYRTFLLKKDFLRDRVVDKGDLMMYMENIAMKAISFILLLTISSLLSACVGAKQRGLAADAAMRGRMEQQKYESSSFFIKITCNDDADKVIDGKFVLEPPFSYKVYPGKSYRLTLHFPDGRCYDGYVETLQEGGAYGRYPGYEICIDDMLMREIDTRGSLSFFLQAPTGERILRITLYKR